MEPGASQACDITASPFAAFWSSTMFLCLVALEASLVWHYMLRPGLDFWRKLHGSSVRYRNCGSEAFGVSGCDSAFPQLSEE